MYSSSKHEVAVNFGYDNAAVILALSKQNFACAGDLIEYLNNHEKELEREMKENEEKEERERQEVKEKEEREQQELKEKEERERQEKLRYLREETEQLFRTKLCVVCERRPRTIVTLPCSHFALCSSCKTARKFCPISDCNLFIEVALLTFV